MTFEELQQIYEQVGERTGWDFSSMNTEREPVPFNFLKIAQQYLKKSDYVLDIGTGGGEKFLTLAQFLEKGIGIDHSAEMIKVAKENAAKDKIHSVIFVEMKAERLQFPENIFDVVLARNAPVFPSQIIKVLKHKGYFLTQQVAAKNRQNLKDVFNHHPKPQCANDNQTLIKEFEKGGCRIVASGEYNAQYWMKDIPSFVFWLKGRDFPKGFSIEKHWKHVNETIEKYTTPKGIVTNENRELLVIQRI